MAASHMWLHLNKKKLPESLRSLLARTRQVQIQLFGNAFVIGMKTPPRDYRGEKK